MLKHLLREKLKYKGRWKSDITLYTYVQSTRLVTEQVAVKPNGRKLPEEINGDVPKSVIMPEV